MPPASPGGARNKKRPEDLGAPHRCPPPKSPSRGASSKAIGAAAVAGAAGATLYHADEGEDEGEESEEEESEEAQVCWSVAFTFLPVIIEIVMEFGSAAADAVRDRSGCLSPLRTQSHGRSRARSA